MAIDGVKIIDSDDGHDIYDLIVERYRDGTSIDTIVSEILGEEQNFCTDEFYTEIYWTAVAYSLWKIGYLPQDIKEKVLDIIAKGAHEFWLEIDSKALKQRQKVLEKLAAQLQSENPKPLKVRKSKTKREPHFKVGDVSNFGIDTDCWFNHKDLGLLLDHLEIIGAVELYPCELWTLAPRSTLEDIYEEVTDEPRIGRLHLIDTYELVKEVIQK